MSKRGNTQRILIITVVAAFLISSLSVSALVIWDLTRDKDDTAETADQSTEDIQKQLEELQKQQEAQKGAKVEKTDINVGDGEEAVAGKKVTVHYTGTLKSDGTKFDSSLDRGEPFTFTLGAGEVIKGWDQGVEGMKVGGKRKLVIPAVLAYGEASPSPDIPPNSDLVFEVELLNVE
ncbi:MAG TPA: FKBP-type peptidyl-prolyl cis-trans isomerase [Candidatus Saccharimonadales bacterium]|jgi:FKBP-type peptidyl-prolyl cis-trans isomerase FkpA|nr:FKBP-type peptidyl-prolyl cis-trans isomerase [Candidatus Saccharimonadales bacterium]